MIKMCHEPLGLILLCLPMVQNSVYLWSKISKRQMPGPYILGLLSMYIKSHEGLEVLLSSILYSHQLNYMASQVNRGREGWKKPLAFNYLSL